jgi:hypothetical protein
MAGARVLNKAVAATVLSKVRRRGMGNLLGILGIWESQWVERFLKECVREKRDKKAGMYYQCS